MPSKLKAAIVNPTDRYKEKGEALHKYGQYLMSCLPKYVQQYADLTSPKRSKINALQVLGLEG